MCGRDRPAQNCEILTEHIDLTPIDRAPARHNTIARRLLLLHPEIGAAMGDKHVELFEAAFIQQQINTFACSQLAPPMLRIDPLLAATDPRCIAPRFKFGQNVFHRLSSEMLDA